MLALHIVVAVAIVFGACVSLYFTGNQHLASCISDLVVYSGRCWVEKKKNIWMSR